MTVDTYTHYQLYYDTIQGTIIKVEYSSDIDPESLIDCYPNTVPYEVYIWWYNQDRWVRSCAHDGWLARSSMNLRRMSRLEFLTIFGHSP